MGQTDSYFRGLKPSLSVNPSHCSPSFLVLKYLLRGFPGLFTVTSEHICFLLLVFLSLFLHLLVVGSVREIKPTRVGFRAHVKIASRIVSYRMTDGSRYRLMLPPPLRQGHNNGSASGFAG